LWPARCLLRLWKILLMSLSPGSYCDIKTYNLVSRLGKQVLQRAFLALGPAIAAFKQCDQLFA
jgi:hypothetical protein